MTRHALAGALLVVSVAGTPGCAWVKGLSRKPSVKLQKVDLVGVDFQRARFRADLEVRNRVAVPVKIARVTWAVKVDGNGLASGELGEPLEVAALGVAPVQVPFTLEFEQLYAISQRYKDQDDAPYRLEGSLAVETPLGPVSLPFKHEGTVPVLRLPVVELSKADVRGVGFGGADVRFKFHVKNPNRFPLDVQALDYALVLAGSKVLDGKLPAPLSVPAKGSGPFDAEVKVSFQQAAAAAQVIAGSGHADYSLTGNLSAGTPWGVVTTPYSRSGTIRVQK